LFLTSWGDTVYCLLGRLLWFQYVYRALRDSGQFKNALHWKSIWPLPMVLYGDDNVDYLPSYCYEYYVGKPWSERATDDKPWFLSKFLKKAVNISMKMSDSNVFFSRPGIHALWSEVNWQGQLVTAGPKFLQRRFVVVTATETMLDANSDLCNPSFVAWRPVEDYYVRASTTVGSTTWAGYLAKLAGLAVDTAGSNASAYHFLRYVYRAVARMHPEALIDDEYRLSTDREFTEYRRKMVDSGWLSSGMFPRFDDLRMHFWPKKSEVAMCVQEMKRTGHYQSLHS